MAGGAPGRRCRRVRRGLTQRLTTLTVANAPESSAPTCTDAPSARPAKSTLRLQVGGTVAAALGALSLLAAALANAPDAASPPAPAVYSATPSDRGARGHADASARQAVVTAAKAFDTAIAAAQATPGDDAAGLHAAAEPLLAHLDLPRITRLLLPHHWRTATETDRLALEQALVEHLLARHAPALRQLHDWRLELLPRQPPASDRAPTLAEVPVAISARGVSELRLTLRLSSTDDGWQLYDAALFGMSVVAMVRSSLPDLVADADTAGLIATGHR